MVIAATDPTLKKFNKGTERYGHEFDASLCGHVRNSDMFHSNTLQSFTLCTELQANVVYTMITHTYTILLENRISSSFDSVISNICASAPRHAIKPAER